MTERKRNHTLKSSSNKIDEQVKNPQNNRAAIAMMVVFLAPVIIAYLLLETGLYQQFGTANRGILLEPPTNLLGQIDVPVKQLREHWWLAYKMPEQCQEQCQQRLLQLRQSIQTLGPEQHRVRPLILTNEASDLENLQIWSDQLKEHQLKSLQVNTTKTEAELFENDQQTHELSSGGLYIVDPMGYIMLYYAPVKDADAAISQAKSLLKDLKYMLKVSRIG